MGNNQFNQRIQKEENIFSTGKKKNKKIKK